MSRLSYGKAADQARRAEARVEEVLADRRFGAAFVIAATAWVFALRYASAAAHMSAGPDYGHYLIAANWYSLIDRSGEGPFDPPVVPLALLALSVPLGRLGALQAAGPLAAALLVPCAFYLFSRFVPRWAALLGATTFALWQQFTEFITFGGVTNLVGIALSLVLFRAFFDTMEGPRPGIRPSPSDLRCALLLFAVLSTHHLTAFITGATLLAWTAACLLLDQQARRAVAWAAARVFGIAAVLGAVYVPYLLSLLGGEVESGFGRPNDPAQSLSVAFFVFRDTTWVWQTFLILAVAALFRIRRGATILPMASALLFTPPLLIFTVLSTHPVRGMFFETAALVGVALLWSARDSEWLRPLRRPPGIEGAARALFLAFALVSTATLSIETPARQEDALSQFHQFFTPGTLEAMDFVAHNTLPTSVIAIDRGIAPDFNDMWKGAATGWWLEGWANRRAIYEASVQLLPFSSKWGDARDANRLFAGENILENGQLRVADNFPRDDAALPRILTGYLQDYHEFVGFSSPRLLSVASGLNHTLQESAQPDLATLVAPSTGSLGGSYLGPGFRGYRSVDFDAVNNVVALSMEFAFEPGAPWDTLEVSMTLPPWVEADFATLGGGRVALVVPERFGYAGESGHLAFSLENLSTPALAPSYLSVGEGGVGLRFTVESSTARMIAAVTVERLAAPAPEALPLAFRAAGDILAEQGVTHLYVGTDSAANLQRFDRQAPRFARLFSNAAAVVFEVRPV